MAYNPYNAVNAIYKLKGQWDSANNAGDDAKKNKAATDAQKYYAELRRNGYGSVADELSANDYAGAQAIRNRIAKTDKTPARKYLYDLGAAQGMSQEDMDKIIGWDNDTGQVSLGGKVIGTPDAVIDGVSYFKDPTVLDSAFSDYVSRTGSTRSKSTMVNQENEALMKRLVGEYTDLKETNPFTTEQAKAILAKYDLSGLKARDNEAASGAGSNGGNIDSFAAANALRQQSALVNQGQQVVLQQYQQKLDHARNLLSDMGVHIDRVYNQDENTKNNEASRQDVYSGITGTVSDTVTKLMNGNIWDENGSLKNANVDFQAQINDLETTLNLTTDANERARIKEQLRVLEAARNQKIDEQGLSYGKTYKYQGAPETYTAKKDKADRESAERITNAGIASEEKINAANNASAIEQIKTGAKYGTTNSTLTAAQTKPTLTAAQAAQAIKNGETSQAVLDAYNYYYGTNYTVDNLPKTAGGPMSDEDVKWWVDDLNRQVDEKYPGKTAINKTGANTYKKGDIDADWIIIRVLESDSLTPEQQEYLLCDKFGITEDQINTAMKDPHYR